MRKNWLIVLLLMVFVGFLYIVEMSKVKFENGKNMPTLDNLQTDEMSKNWDLFYKVRATIIDGQSARFSIPDELEALDGNDIKLSGAAKFFGNGSKIINDSTTRVNSFILLPTLSLAQSCVLDPAEAMRWTIIVHLTNPMTLKRNDMINTLAIVSGKLKIDTSKPYEAAFFIENATATIK